MTLSELQQKFPEIDFSTWDKAMVKKMLAGSSAAQKPQRSLEIGLTDELQRQRIDLASHTDFSYQHKKGRLLQHIANCEAQYHRWKGGRAEVKGTIYRGLKM